MRSAVLYLRLSEADDASTSIARQEADLRARAEREGWRVTATLTDDGFSGRKARAKAESALSMIPDRTADVLMVWKFDRCSRQGLTALADLIRVLEKREDALFIADRDGLSSDQPAWRIVASVLAEAAKTESDNTKLRVKSSIIALKHAHRFAGGTVPYGYRPAPNHGGPGRILVLEPSEVVLINEMADRVLAGESPWRIANDLNERRTPAPRSDARRLGRHGRSIEDAPRLGLGLDRHRERLATDDRHAGLECLGHPLLDEVRRGGELHRIDACGIDGCSERRVRVSIFGEYQQGEGFAHHRLAELFGEEHGLGVIVAHQGVWHGQSAVDSVVQLEGLVLRRGDSGWVVDP